METIKEIAVACGVSEQSIRKWCKRNQVAKQRNQVSKESYVIDESTKQAILQYYHADASNGTSKPSCETEKSQDTAINALTEQLKEKDKQLAEKDKQLEALNQQLATLTNALASAQEAQTRLTESLAAEQALHAGTMQKQLAMQDEKPVGFFGRLFRKKKKENGDEIQG